MIFSFHALDRSLGLFRALSNPPITIPRTNCSIFTAYFYMVSKTFQYSDTNPTAYKLCRLYQFFNRANFFFVLQLTPSKCFLDYEQLYMQSNRGSQSVTLLHTEQSFINKEILLLSLLHFYNLHCLGLNCDCLMRIEEALIHFQPFFQNLMFPASRQIALCSSSILKFSNIFENTRKRTLRVKDLAFAEKLVSKFYLLIRKLFPSFIFHLTQDWVQLYTSFLSLSWLIN